MLQAYGAGLWKEWNAAIAFLLPDDKRAGSFACHQELVRCQFQVSNPGFGARAAGDADRRSDVGVRLNPVGVGHTLASCLPSRQHFCPENLIALPLS